MYGPGSASFQLVAWTMRRRTGRWSFWQRGTGETMMQHHCRGTENSEPADAEYGGVAVVFKCRECGARATHKTRIDYFRKDWKS